MAFIPSKGYCFRENAIKNSCLYWLYMYISFQFLCDFKGVYLGGEDTSRNYSKPYTGAPPMVGHFWKVLTPLSIAKLLMTGDCIFLDAAVSSDMHKVIQLWQHLFYIYKYSASCRYLQHRCTKELGEKVVLYQQEAAYLISQSHIALLTSMGPKIQLSKWLFVMAWKETTLQSLMENWSVVRYQTNWSLEPVLSFCDSELATIQTDNINGGQVLNQSTPQADPPTMATDGANTVMEILNSEEQSELQPTPLPIPR